MKRFSGIFFVLLILAFSSLAFGVEIRGLVVDAKTGEPLPGVNVLVKDKPVGAATDEDGFFILSYETQEPFTLVFSYVGYKAKEIQISPDNIPKSLTVKLSEDVFRSEEIVVTGIASKTSRAVAEIAVSRVNAQEFSAVNAYQDISQLLFGKVAGVQLKPSSGNVGGGFRFYVRAGGGLNGNEQPVIYIDGVRVDNAQVTGFGVGGQGISTLADLNPEDIAKIEVLKGPAAAASYGTSGSNGVVLITTKRGQLVAGAKGGVSVEYKSVFGWNEQSYKYTENDFLSYKDANAIFRDGPIQQNRLSISGGTNFLRYYASWDRRLESGILRNNDMDRKTVRANIEAFPTQKLTLSISTQYSLNELSRPNNDNNIYGYLGNTLLFAQSYRFTDSASIEGLNDKWRNNHFLGSFKATYEPIKNLKGEFKIGMDNSNMRQDETFPANLVYAFVPSGRRRIYQRRSLQFTYDLNVSYTYNITPDLQATSIVGAQLLERKFRTNWQESEVFLTELIMDIGAGASFTDMGEGLTHQREAGIFTEHSLSYKDQYFLRLMLRRDYASSVGTKAPSIVYPKFGFAVRLDKYSFFPKLFNMMKARIAYGETGTLPNPTDPIPILWTAAQSGYGGGAVPSGFGNPEIKPERVKELEIGFDTEFLTNYSLEFTYYFLRAEQSIVDFRNPPSTGKTASNVPFNVGKSEGYGFEVLLQASPIRTRNFNLDFTITSSYQKNEVKDLGGAQPIFDPFDINVIKEGLPKHEFYTQKVLGASYDTSGVYVGPKLSDERFALGNPIPKYIGSFSTTLRLFRDFRIYVLLDWATGHKILNFTNVFATRFGNKKVYNDLRDQLSNLTPGTSEYKAVAEKLAFVDWRADYNFIEDADFLKLREISVSYSLRRWLDKFNATRYLGDVVLGFSARNVWTTTKYSGADVEVNFAGARSLVRGQDFLTLQNPRAFNFWIKISL